MPKPDLVAAAKLEELDKASKEYRVARSDLRLRALAQVEEDLKKYRFKRDNLVIELEKLRREDPVTGFGHGLTMNRIKDAARISNHNTFREIIDLIDFGTVEPEVDYLKSLLSTYTVPFVGTWYPDDFLGYLEVTQFLNWTGKHQLRYGRTSPGGEYAATLGFVLVGGDEWVASLPGLSPTEIGEPEFAALVADFTRYAYEVREAR